MRYIVLVSGFSKSGKDVFADFLVKHNCIKYSFAEELKIHVAKKYNFDYNLTQTQEGKSTLINSDWIKSNNSTLTTNTTTNTTISNTTISNTTTIRDLLIAEACTFRLKNPNYYAIKLVEKINFIDKIKDYRGELKKNIVISDWRYPNEYTFIKTAFNCKVITVRINRHKESQVNSETEHYLDDFKFDYIIENKYSIEDLYKNIINKLYFLFD